MGTRSSLKITDRFAIAALMSKHLRKAKNGQFKYADGWSDERLAVHYGKGITAHNVRSVRVAAYGPLMRVPKTKPTPKPKPADNTGAGILQRLEKLESAVRALCKEWGVDYE